ncbi:MAG TPA: exopolyphosphatase [Pseudomonadota bacterium]|nr:exopolyphosphatase [Xanthomonadales bacterium]HQY35695.1 exopolyphosphatase [Pseudomonadota bacterium]HRA36951.1 exopolyphosphatase [Pseudomonadota bacterium]
MPTESTKGIREGDSLAAVDLGSNSFHLVVARYEHGEIRVIDRLRDTVRMAMGLRPDGSLEPERQRRALTCLARFGQRLRELPPERVRAVATNTVRQLRSPRAFLLTAETALGHPIEVVSGREEARLIYLGVANGIPRSKQRRLVVDIGGGSTEFIIGLGFEPLETESIQIGCIATTRRFFDDGKLTRKRWQKAQTEIEVELQQFAAGYRARGWSDTIGSSGTVRALGAICAALRPADNGITLDGLEDVRERLLEAGEIGRIRLPALSEDRKAVIAGGALILETVFRSLAIERMRACDTAMREGLLYDLVGRAGQSDPREASVLALARRYGVDAAHAARVETTALALFEQVQDAWEFNETQRDWLAWACRVHEIGLAIAHSQHQVHGAYLVANSDLFGFTRQEQQALAFVVRAQRRAIPVDEVNALPERLAVPAARLAVLLRLSALLHRGRTGEVLPRLALKVGDRVIRLALPKDWLDTHPLTRVDLDTERKHLAELNLKLQIIAT